MSLNYDRFNLEVLIQRVRVLLESATQNADAVDAGSAWYPTANTFARRLADMDPDGRLTPLQCAGIVSAFSIRTPWKRNLENATAYVLRDLENVKSMRVHMVKADAIRALCGPDATDPDAVADILHGLKVRAFMDNIHAPDTSSAVTLDTHMVRALGLESHNMLRLRVPSGPVPYGMKRAPSVALYDRIAGAFRAVALETETPVSAVQAIVWCDVRGSAE